MKCTFNLPIIPGALGFPSVTYHADFVTWSKVHWSTLFPKIKMAYTLPQKKGNFRKVAFLLGKNVQDNHDYISVTIVPADVSRLPF